MPEHVMPDNPTLRDHGFRATVASLWFRLISLGIVGLAFGEALIVAPGKVQNWFHYLTAWEIVFEVAVRLAFAGLAGMVLGTIVTAALAPFL